MPLLKTTEVGRKVTEFIKTHGFMTKPIQVQLLRILCNHSIVDKDSPAK